MKRPRKRPKPDVVICASFMPVGLFDAISAAAPETIQKHIFFDQVFRAFIRAWSRRQVPRVYIGQGHHESEQRSFYINPKTVRAVKQIAVADGVSMSTVLRTACAWHLYKGEKGTRRRDLWGTDRIFGPRPKIEC